MAKITFVDFQGNATDVEAEAGTTLMQAALDNGVEGIIGECGGACSCATCHCYVDEAWTAKTGEASGFEKDMLECALEPKPTSRLSCQITLSDELDGLVVHLPESQY